MDGGVTGKGTREGKSTEWKPENRDNMNETFIVPKQVSIPIKFPKRS